MIGFSQNDKFILRLFHHKILCLYYVTANTSKVNSPKLGLEI
ncbi:hypothetical protein C8C85_0139 [Flavobacterium sp. 103]|nr:hypothetical protein C8C85_0139 [Flavobacterium sp. 103]